MDNNNSDEDNPTMRGEHKKPHGGGDIAILTQGKHSCGNQKRGAKENKGTRGKKHLRISSAVPSFSLTGSYSFH